MSKLSPDIYERYLSGTCTPAEELMVLEYFKEHPSALADYMNEAGWEQFDQYALRSQQDVRETLAGIRQHIRRKKMVTIRVLIASAAAASIALAIWLTWPASTPLRPVSVLADRVGGPGYVFWENKSDTLVTRLLEDGSRVSLQPGATLRYAETFAPDARKLWLTGGARFWVAKDTGRPFSVVSRKIITTAVGTSFSVQTIKRDNDSALQVRLFEGKVYVQKERMDHIPGGDERVYLQPGQELIYTPASGKLVRSSMEAPKRAARPLAETYALHTETGFKYKRAPLHKALAILSDYYQIPVTADGKSISGIYITAEFSKTDKLATILQTIATLNDLDLKGNDLEGYQLSH